MFALSGVTAGYGSTTILRDVSIAVPDSSVVALLGPNGAGKTTLLRVASGLLPVTSGTVHLDGVDVSGRPPHRRHDLGICLVPEGRGIFPNLTVRENLRLWSRPGQERRGRSRAVDAFPRLGERLDQIAGTMSGGEQQMLALARAYIAEPRIVLVDEVSMGLAPKLVDEIFVFLRRLAEEGASLLLVEQYVAKALKIADYVCMLDQGRLRFAGEPAELSDQDVIARYLGGNVDAAHPASVGAEV